MRAISLHALGDLVGALPEQRAGDAAAARIGGFPDSRTPSGLRRSTARLELPPDAEPDDFLFLAACYFLILELDRPIGDAWCGR